MAGGLSNFEDEELEESHEINVTPLIDVMLVLLIVFMVAAPLATVDVKVDLPTSTAEPDKRPEKPLFLTLKADLSLLLGEEPVGRDALKAALDAFTSGDKTQRVFLQADRTVAYEQLMAVMNLLRSAGYLSIALVGVESVPAPSISDPSSGDANGAPAANPPAAPR